LFTAASTTLQFYLLGRLNVPTALWYASAAFIGSIIGKLFINALVKRYKKTTYIILCVVIFLGIGCWAMLIEGVGEMVTSFRQHEYFEIASFCSS
jgi:uncharacterized membrane protein YfcA